MTKRTRGESAFEGSESAIPSPLRDQRIAPPLTATDAEIDLGLELLDAALERTLENLRPVRKAPALAGVEAR